jgi:LAO/AO transport system kinase
MRRPFPSVETLVQGIFSGDRVLLGQAITLVESNRPDHQELAREVIGKILTESPSQETLRIGISGAPGVGKSTFIETLGMRLTQQNHRVAVLAIDPTSTISKGSILGDKTRMEKLSVSDRAFIRPSPSGDTLGGVARKTRETILLIEAAGFDVILVETVGVGQSETTVHSMTDLFLLLLLPGAGDELQGIKRGIVEMADILAVNKADGDRLKSANQARAHYLNAVHLLPPKPSGWAPPVLTCSAQMDTGVDEIWKAMQDYRDFTSKNGFFAKNRQDQAQFWFKEALRDGLFEQFYHNASVKNLLKRLEPEITAGRISPFAAASELLKKWMPDPDKP